MELNLIPFTESSALDAWAYNSDTNELFLRWRNSNDIYVYTGNVANFEADVREYRSWGRMAHWYAHSSEDVTLKELIFSGTNYTSRYCYETKTFSTVYA